jgi:transaldolase
VTRLGLLHSRFGQSPWLDNLTRVLLSDGTLSQLVNQGIRGVTANPTIFARAIEGSDAYDNQFSDLVSRGRTVPDAYWDLVVDDIWAAASVLQPTFDASHHSDGFVSIEVDPNLAHETAATIRAARELHERIDRPNVMVKIPATAAGVRAIEAMTAEGRSINVTLIFSISRYNDVIEAYLRGLESAAAAGRDLGSVHSVASFFVSRVDVEVDARLEVLDAVDATALQGCAAIAQAKLAYEQFCEHFAGERWDRLAALGANLQRPLWASTSTKNPTYPDTMYVDSLIGPDTVNTLPEKTIEAYLDHGNLARTIDTNLHDAHQVMSDLDGLGVDLADVAATLESEGIASFQGSFAHLLDALDAKARRLGST